MRVGSWRLITDQQPPPLIRLPRRARILAGTQTARQAGKRENEPENGPKNNLHA